MKARTYVLAPLLVGIVCLLAGGNAVYLVGQAQQAVLLRFGQPVAIINGGPEAKEAGLHLKWPLVDQVALMDRRIIELRSSPAELPRATPTTLQADMRYRIHDPLRFYRAVGDGPVGAQRLSQLLQDGLGRAFASAGPQGSPAARLALDNAITADLRAQAPGLGLEIVDARVIDAAPTSSSVATLAQHMQDAETRQVGQIKADGEQHRRELLAQADRDAGNVRSDGERQALETRGDGDAQRAAILGVAYGGDPAFAQFFRRLEAYDQAFNPDNTTLVLSPDNAFLDLFERGPSAVGKPTR